MELISGREIAKKKEALLKDRIAASGKSPTLVSLVAEEDEDGLLYTKLKSDAAKRVGIEFEAIHFSLKDPKSVLEKLAKIDWDSIDGLIIQKPGEKLAEQYFGDTNSFRDWWVEAASKIPVEKDVDCLSPETLGLLFLGMPKYLPATVKAAWDILMTIYPEGKGLAGKEVVIVGSSEIFGRPLAVLLRNNGVTVSMCGETVKNLGEFVSRGDIVITGVGKPNLITGEMVKDGVIVIDAGISKVEGKIVGDVDFESVSRKATHITPVPGGVGPLTVICLLENVALLA